MATNTLPGAMRPANPSRRALIAGAGLAALTTTLPVVAHALPSSFSIEQHWQARCQAYREFEADPEVPDDNERTNDYWDRIDAAEIAILNSPDTSARAAELRLWVAWSHANPSHAAGRASNFVELGDVSALLRIRSGLDWHEKLIFAAILNLRGEG